MVDESRLSRIERRQAQMQAGLDNLADEVLGPAVEDFDGNRIRSGGMKGDIAEMRAILGNGAIRITLSPGIWAAIITSLGTVIAAIIIVGG